MTLPTFRSFSLVLLVILVLTAFVLGAGPAPPKEPATRYPDSVEAAFAEKARELKPGEEGEVEVRTTDGGYYTRRYKATASGVHFVGTGSKTEFKGDLKPPSLGSIPGDGQGGAGGGEGGGADDTSASATGFVPLDKAWKNPIFWIGVALILGGLAAAYFMLRRASIVLIVGGAALVFGATYPLVAGIAVCAVVGWLAFPYIKAEWDAVSTERRFKKVASGIDSSSLDPTARRQVKRAIASRMDDDDVLWIENRLRKWRVGKYSAAGDRDDRSAAAPVFLPLTVPAVSPVPVTSAATASAPALVNGPPTTAAG